MDNKSQDTTGIEHHSQKRLSIVTALMGAVGGVALFVGGMAFYFTRVERLPPPLPPSMGGGAPSGAGKSAAAAKDDEDLVMETPVIDIVPLSELHLKIKSGKALSVEVPKDSGLTAKVEDTAVTISASKDAKEGTHQITVRGSKGKKATIQVNLKVANPVTTPKTSEHP